MGIVIYMLIMFVAKIIDNMLYTTKMIFVQRNKCLLASLAAIISDLIYFTLTKNIVNASNDWAIYIVALASGVGCFLAMMLNRKFSKDRLYVNVLMSDDMEAMKDLRDYLTKHHITCVAAKGYTKDWNKETITITAYAETKAASKLIDEYVQNSSVNFKRIVSND